MALVQEDGVNVKTFWPKKRRISPGKICLCPISPVCTCSCWKKQQKSFPLKKQKNKTKPAPSRRTAARGRDAQSAVGRTADGEPLADGIPGMPPRRAFILNEVRDVTLLVIRTSGRANLIAGRCGVPSLPRAHVFFGGTVLWEGGARGTRTDTGRTRRELHSETSSSLI